MARLTKPLTATEVKNTKPKDKLYKLADGGGLSLWVYPTGNKNWVVRYNQNGRREEIRKPFNDLSLAEARAWREEVKARAKQGEILTPIAKAKIERLEKKKNVIFGLLFNNWYERWKDTVTPKYGKQVYSAVMGNCMDVLGAMDIKDIKPFHVVESLRGMEARGALEYLRRTKVGIKLAFDYAVSCGLVDINPALQVTPQAFKKHQPSNFRALPPNELPQLIQAIEDGIHSAKIKPLTYLLIYWQLLSICRPNEAVTAEWAEIDYQEKTWTITAEKMKARRNHVIPLTDTHISILERLRALNVDGVYLFEGKASHMSRETVRMAFNRLNINTTAHGLRALARTYLGETGKFNQEPLELCLAHSIGSKTEQAYNRGQYLEERREILNYWAEVVEKEKKVVKGF